ncbi:tyrosine recombinase XerC [Pengzhenrongella phosphoraccumulans]|uniref:site-specific integrase n=1 Tax=Pengzhenrongella phosphoraccumulans TaxID=3114394 RepID=UPI00388EF259
MARPRTPIGAYGETYFEETPSGKIQAEVRFRDHAGRPRKVKATGRSKAEALRKVKRKIATDELATAGTDELTADSPFTDLVDAWLASLDGSHRLAPSTRYRYERDMRTLVLPAFEHFTLREITVRKVDRLLKELYQLSYNRAQKAKVVLNLCFKLAVRWEAIDRNPVAGVETLHQPAHQASALTLETVEIVRAMVAAWERHPDGKPGPKPDGQVGAIIETMLGTSARIGEVLALRRCDVDLETMPPTVRIAGTIISLDDGPTFRQDHPKTNRSRRTVTIPAFAATALAQRLARIGDVEPEHLVFFTRNDTPITTNNFRRTLRTVLKKSDAAGVTPHAFRRTVATTIDRAGGIDLAAELLGHTSTEITRVHYIEPNELVNPKTADILERMLAPGANPLGPKKDPHPKRVSASKKKSPNSDGVKKSKDSKKSNKRRLGESNDGPPMSVIV